MSHLLCLAIGGILATGFMCCFQINTINRYRDEIDRLKRKLNEK